MAWLSIKLFYPSRLPGSATASVGDPSRLPGSATARVLNVKLPRKAVSEIVKAPSSNSVFFILFVFKI